MRRTLLLLAGLSCLTLPIAASDSYASIDGAHLKQYVEELAAMSRRYRDSGHSQFWGRIIGTEVDAENGRWLAGKFKTIGLSDVREQRFDLPPQWMPQSWSVSASGGGKELPLGSAQPTYRSEATPAAGLSLEAVDVGLATDADLARQDLKGKAVFFYSNDYMSRHATASNGAWKRISEKGAAAIFITLMIPGNLRFQFYPVQSPVPTFSLGLEDGLSVRDMIARSSGGAALRVNLRLDVKMTPDLQTATIWGSLPGTTDENIMVVAHRDGWFEGANDNATGIATLLGIAEYFARISAERRRTITFIGSTGHHDGTAEASVALQHGTVRQAALLIYCEQHRGEPAGRLQRHGSQGELRRRPLVGTWEQEARADRARRLRDVRRADLRPRRTRRRRRDRAHPEPGAVASADRHRPVLALGSRDTGHHSAGGVGGHHARLREDHRGGRWRRSAGSAASSGVEVTSVLSTMC
jgi:hypothetical protein